MKELLEWKKWKSKSSQKL